MRRFLNSIGLASIEHTKSPLKELLMNRSRDIEVQKAMEATELRSVKAYLIKGSNIDEVVNKFNQLKSQNPTLPITNLTINSEHSNINIFGFYKKNTFKVEGLVLLTDKHHLVTLDEKYIRGLVSQQHGEVDLTQSDTKPTPRQPH